MDGKPIDLTQTIIEGIPDWDGCCGFQMNNISDYTDGVCVQAIQMPIGIGTHIDAPNHFIKGGLDISAISLQKLICPGVVIDVSHKATEDYAISENDIVDFEQQHGQITKGSIVICYTGWGSRWDSAKAYRNADAQGIMRFPKFSLEAVKILLQRDINAIAIDTLSPDGSDNSFPVHHKILGNGKFIIENIKVSDELPEKGFTVIALPIKIKNATEAPCRVIAIVDK